MERNSGYYRTTSFLEHMTVTSTTCRGQKSQIELHFSYESKFSFFVLNREFSDEPELVGIFPCRGVDKIVILDTDELSDSEKAREIIGDKLSNSFGAIEADLRRRWVNSALRKAREVVGSMPAAHNIALIWFPAVFKVDYVYDDNARVVENNRNSCMVPAAEMWVDRFLVTKTLTEYSGDGFGTNCTVCLESFSGEVFMMPCSHYFHGDCIRKWLRTSHYCPVCRFEVPTSSSMVKD